MNFPIPAIFGDQTMQSLKLSLHSSAIRQEAIAANIANVNTPGYKRVDLTPQFNATLKEALEQLDRGETSSTPLFHKNMVGQDPVRGSERLDGNNVNLDSEMVEMAKNQSQFEFAAQLMAKRYRGLREAITGRGA